QNILDKFNPGARQMITAGKAYLKALHGAAAASRLYVDAVGKLGRQAQQGTWGGCADIGTALMKVVEVYREIQDQQMNILKAFYVDLLVPLETNLEKDTKVVQSEQKRFLQQHKLRSESYSKAAATIKKQRKKKTNVTKVGSAMDKEMKNMQILEEEKTKLDAFCEQSLKNAMTQERRRYGFVLERQCSLAKHWLAYHSSGAAAYNTGLEEWLEVSRTREYLPPNVEAMFVSRMRTWIFAQQLAHHRSRHQLAHPVIRHWRVLCTPTQLPATTSSASNKAMCWPCSVNAPKAGSTARISSPARWSCVQTPGDAPPPAPVTHAQPGAVTAHAHPPTRMFGDTVTAHHVNKGRLGNGSPGLPPTLPAPSPSALSSSASATFHSSTPAAVATSAIKSSTSAASFTTHAVIETRTFGPQTLPMRSQMAQNKAGPAKTVVSAVGAVGNVSLHSSNDSGFSNEPPPQPDVDYSDEEAQRLRVPISKSAQHTNDHKAYLLKTQSLKRGPKQNNANGYLTDDQQLMLRSMLDMDKDSQRVKRTKSFWKFGRTTNEEIMEGMSLWQHRDIVDTVPEYKKKLFVKIKKELRPAPEIPDARKQASPEKTPPIENGQSRPKETIDRKDIKVTNGIRQAKSLGSIENEDRLERSRKSNEVYHQNHAMNKKSTSEKVIAEEKLEEVVPRNESRHSDLTNTSTIKTNFENSFYNDENGDGFVMKTVKRREILQRYDNDSNSDNNSVASSTDPYDCIIVDDHMTSRKQQELDKRRQTQTMEDNIKTRKENVYMPEFEEIEVTPIKPHVRATLSSDKAKRSSHEHSPPKTMEFKTFKDNSKEIKTFSASSETLKYKDNEPVTDRYGIPTERNNNEIRNDNSYNGHDEEESTNQGINKPNHQITKPNVIVEVILAEYDKRTFPRDCVDSRGEGQQCVENIAMHAEDVVLHPQYDDSRGYNLVASVSKYGIVFIGLPDGNLAVYYLKQLIDKECDPQHMLVQLQENPTHISVSCDQELLAVTGGQLLVVYKVVDFQNQNVSPALSVKCDVNPSTFVSDLKWNPCIPDTIAIAFYDGTLTVLQASTGQVKKVQSKASDGTLYQYKPDLSPMKSVPAPNIFQGSPVEALAIHWISTYQFAVVYRNAADNSRPAVTIVNTPKAGQPTCLNYEDICYSMGSNRPWYYYLHGVAQWNIILCSSSNSMEMATLGTADGANCAEVEPVSNPPAAPALAAALQAKAQPKPAPTPQKDQTQELNAALKAEQELANKQKANQELKSMLIREVNEFQMELYKFVTKTRQAQIQNLDADAIKKDCSLEDLRNAIITLKLDLVRACAVVAEARTHSDAKDLDQWTQADPLTTKRVASVKKLAYYVQSQLEQAHRALDYKWNQQAELDMKLKKPGHRMIRPILDDVYQPLVRQQEILSRQQALLKTLRSTLNECNVTPAFKTTSILRTTPDPLSKLTKNILNMSIEPQSKENKNLLTSQKLDALRDMLSNHKTVKIKPVNVEMRHHLTAMRISYEKITAPPVSIVKKETTLEVKPPLLSQPPTQQMPITVKKTTAPQVVRTLFTEVSSVIVATPTSFTSKPISELNNMFTKFAPQAFVPESKSSETGETNSLPLKVDAKKEEKPMSNLFAMRTSTPLQATQNVPDVLGGNSKTFTFKRVEPKAEPKLEPKPDKVIEKSKENVPEKASGNVILSIPKVTKEEKNENETKPLSAQNTNKQLFGSNTQPTASSPTPSDFTSDEVPKPIAIKSEIKTEAFKVVPKSETAQASSSSIFATASATITGRLEHQYSAIAIPMYSAVKLLSFRLTHELWFRRFGLRRFNKSPGGFGTSATFGGAAFGGSGFGGGSPGSVFGGAASQPNEVKVELVDCSTLRLGQYICPDPSINQIDPDTQQFRGCVQGKEIPSEGEAEVQCIAAEGIICEGTRNSTFKRKMPCKWTNGYSLEIALLLSVVGPSDGSAYVIPYYGAGVTVVRSDNETYLLPQSDWHNIT
ncbi:hypothetical protein MSG28_004148, partial [Choristoneura fumiferana]